MGPQWPSGTLSLKAVGFQSQNQIPLMARFARPPAGVARKLGKGGASSSDTLVIRPRLKITKITNSAQNSPRIASKRDLNPFGLNGHARL
ncbi:hypothetical protein AVEN_41142-1 [Araneus ventricosus]|uniref:Uncharacterized protein n=1 Tax=Araneus ventricosus TaxID=182803 RepID=A0A4Y2R2I2_ARAVE|nr:hypothetical protein AVEN_41142-1 [Araneus ventricosus]